MAYQFLFAEDSANTHPYASFQVAIDEHGCPLLGEAPQFELTVRVSENLSAGLLTPDAFIGVKERGIRFVPARTLLSDRRVARAVGLLRNRMEVLFDPADGSPLSYDDANVVARGERGRPLFPRIDPAVIGLIQLEGTTEILVARGRGRQYYSLIAGYVEHGENLEEAFIREAREETGLAVSNVTYWGSQPWPVGGSIMAGFIASVASKEPVDKLDGELEEIRWIRSEDIPTITLPGEGSIARAMLADHYRRVTGEDFE